MITQTKRSTNHQKVTKVTQIIASIMLCGLTIWGATILWKRLAYTYTNDAQVTQYINPVIARVGGYILHVNYQDHQKVKRGDTLLIIDNREYLLEADQARADIGKEDAELNVLNSQKQILEQEHSALLESVAASEAKVHKQQLEYERYLFLYNNQSATKQQLEEIQEKLQIHKSEYNALKFKLIASEERINDIEVKKNVISAEKGKLYAAEDRKHLDLNYTVLTAPYDGVMGKRSVENGQMISAGEVLAYIINDETPIWVTANFKETQLRHLHICDSVDIVADAFPDEVFTGRIISISPATGSSFSLLPPDNSTGNFVKIVQRVPVRIEVDRGQHERKLLSGMNVNVYVTEK